MDYCRPVDRNGTLQQRSDSRVPRTIYRPIEYRHSSSLGLSRTLALSLRFHSDNIARDGSLNVRDLFSMGTDRKFHPTNFTYLGNIYTVGASIVRR